VNLTLKSSLQQVSISGKPGQNIVFLPIMNLLNVMLLSLAAVFIIIAIYEVMTLGPGSAYWAIMLSVLFFFAYTLRKKK
jgi:hypothetical protein